MFRIIPVDARAMTSDEPPYDMKGRGIPVRGTSATIAEKFIIAWRPIQIIIPEARSWENLSGAWEAIFKPLDMRARKIMMTILAPINPTSSPMTAKMESVLTSGK